MKNLKEFYISIEEWIILASLGEWLSFPLHILGIALPKKAFWIRRSPELRKNVISSSFFVYMNYEHSLDHKLCYKVGNLPQNFSVFYEPYLDCSFDFRTGHRKSERRYVAGSDDKILEFLLLTDICCKCSFAEQTLPE